MIDVSHVADPLRVFLSAGPYNRPGWIATQQDELDLLKPDEWEQSFGARPIAALLAEHVWEHLSLADGIEAARTCFRFLAPGGYVRCAVPDALFPDAAYQQLVAVNGPGPAADHQIVYDYRTLLGVFATAGFAVRLLEWWDEQGQFHFADWNPEDGLVYRSRRFDARNRPDEGVYGFTSLIVDAIKTKR